MVSSVASASAVAGGASDAVDVVAGDHRGRFGAGSMAATVTTGERLHPLGFFFGLVGDGLCSQPGRRAGLSTCSGPNLLARQRDEPQASLGILPAEALQEGDARLSSFYPPSRPL